MKKITILLFLSAIALRGNFVNAQMQWANAQSILQSQTTVNQTKIAADANGNIYCVGSFTGTNDFGNSVVLTAVSTSGTDAFIAKYDPTGNCLWAKRFGYTSSSTQATTVCVDLNDDVYLCGIFNNTLQIDTNYFISQGQDDIFFLKLNFQGNTIYTKIIGGQSMESIKSITSDVNGNIYMTGDCRFKTFFDNDSIVTGNIFSDIFIAKYDSIGNLAWLKKAGSSADNDIGLSIKYLNGNLFVAGNINGTCNFGSNIVTAAAQDGFISKYNPINGNNIWVKKYGGTANDACADMSMDSYGSAYVTGTFILQASFGGIVLNAGNTSELFIAKYDSLGNCSWAKKAGAPNFGETSKSISTDPYGYSIITGSFSGTANFGSHGITSSGATDIYVAKYDPTGTCQYVLKGGAIGDDYGSGTCWIPSVNYFAISGGYSGSVTFGSSTLNMISPNTSGVFLAKIPGFYTGMENLETLFDSEVYPNPVVDVLNIDLSDRPNMVISAKVYSLVGEVVIDTTLENESQVFLDLSHLKPAYYLLKIGNKDGTYLMKKILKV